MATTETTTGRGLRVHDLVGLVVGYGLAALLARSFWTKDRPLEGFAAVALTFEFGWLGLAMSGPVVLLLGRRGWQSGEAAPRRPARPGRLISRLDPPAPPIGRGAEPPPEPEAVPYTRAEMAWILIGGYWIALTMFVVPVLSYDTPWALVGVLQVVAAVGIWAFAPVRPVVGRPAVAWTHRAAVGLIWSWPIAWFFLVVLGRSLS